MDMNFEMNTGLPPRMPPLGTLPQAPPPPPTGTPPNMPSAIQPSIPSMMPTSTTPISNEQGETKEPTELKPRTIRATESTIEDFKALTSKYGWKNQDEALSNIVKAYEMANAPNVLPEREMEIKNFAVYLDKLKEMFLSTLQTTENALTEKKSEYSLLHSDKQRLAIECVEAQKSQKQAEATVETQNLAMAALKDEISSLKEREQKLYEGFSKLAPQSDELEAIISKLKAENEQLHTQNKTLEESKQSLTEKLNQSAEDYNTKLSGYLENLEKSRQEVHSLRSQKDASRNS